MSNRHVAALFDIDPRVPATGGTAGEGIRDRQAQRRDRYRNPGGSCRFGYAGGVPPRAVHLRMETRTIRRAMVDLAEDHRGGIMLALKNTDKAREDRARAKLRRRGYRVYKSRVRNTHCNNWGGYLIVDASINGVVGGSNYDLTLDDLEDWASEE